MIKVIEADILKADTKYVAHQTNLSTPFARGVAEAIFKKYPYCNSYIKRKRGMYIPDPKQLGSIEVYGDGVGERFVINMNAQFYPGGCSNPTSVLDGHQAREKYFIKCLENISKIQNIESISFPYFIGCGLAGGNWKNYLKYIEQFAKTISEQNAQVFLYRIDNKAIY